ncbi:MAG: patatin-like phospholipase family protein [Desulfobacteraceae bacterium]|nr:patatin-like phospholipase family protein [Desulfobacteraceae bacterium]
MKIFAHRQAVVLLSLIQLLAAIPMARAEVPRLRAAIAISGGASMGAYEAGLNWGIIETTRRFESSGVMPSGGVIRPIQAAGIAGTSAGGINTLLSALTWSVLPEAQGGFANRIDNNVFRDVWLMPDVNQLLPTDADSPDYFPDDALLARKELVAGSRALREKWRRPGSFRPGMRIALGVTVTRVEPEIINIGGIEVKNQRFYVPFEMRTQADGSAAFFFDPGDYPLFRDPDLIILPNESGQSAFVIPDQRIEEAILTTSAFPVGFGRRRLQYCRQAELSSNEKQSEGQTTTPATAYFCPAGYTLAEAEFSDGGLFDNLPIGLARRLAESGAGKRKQALPVSYIYLDPGRERFQAPAVKHDTACTGQNPPDACRAMPFNFTSESAVLGGALGTARKYELYRELTGDRWRLNLPLLCRRVAQRLEKSGVGQSCRNLLPYFDQELECADKIRHSARLLELSYGFTSAPIATPFSVDSLSREKMVTNCRSSAAPAQLHVLAECGINSQRLRKELAQALVAVMEDSDGDGEAITDDILVSAVSMESDRVIRVTSRGAPITGTLLGAFGAFIEYKFREYDYYVGIYDAVVFLARNRCVIGISADDQSPEFQVCFDRMSQEIYQQLGVGNDPKARFVFALLAQREFGSQGLMKFAYSAPPPADRDMRIIHDGLEKSLLAGGASAENVESAFVVEREFFEHLKAQSFEPTPQADGRKPLLAHIMADPEYWSHELVNRVTARLVYLEEQAKKIYKEREPDPKKRESAYTGVMGASALSLRTATYKYPKFAFAPSTAPDSWVWRNVIPYEVSFDLVGGDMLFLWQPTWNFKRDNLGLRFGFGFANGLFDSRAAETRKNYGTIGLDYTRLTSSSVVSGYGVTPAVYHDWEATEDKDQTTYGADIHALFLKNRLRVGVGMRDILNNGRDTWFLNIGVADLPGICYWLTR